MIYSTEKTINELGEKATPDLKGAVNTALEDAKKALETGDQDKMKVATDALEKVSHKLAEEAYKKAAAEGGAAAGTAGDGQTAQAGAKDDDVVDADYEEVRDSK
jgi:molecular chaperone DnaK